MRISLSTIVVPDYDDAIAFYVGILGFFLIEDRILSSDKRWVVVSPSSSLGHGLLLAKASSEEQSQSIGNQTGGRVAFFLETEDFDSTYRTYVDRGIEFEELPRREEYGTVAVFKDLYGNRWDLLERSDG